ncbi:MAG: hypothetical protein OCD76_06960 [Reichenbachiella sp.]
MLKISASLMRLIIMWSCTNDNKDSLEINVNKEDSIWVKSIVDKSVELDRKSVDSLDILADSLLRFAQVKNNRTAFISGRIMKARYLSKEDQTLGTIDIYHELTRDFKNLSSKDRAVIFNNLGNCQLKLGNFT